MNLGILFALLAPIGWTVAALLDKYILVRKVEHTLAYTAVTGFVGIVLVTIVGFFLDWSQVTWSDMLFPILGGVLGGIFVYLWIYTLNIEDASRVIGFIYLYPALAAALALIFLGEVIPWFGYVGILLTLLGIFLLAARGKKIGLKTAWRPILLIIGVLGIWSFIEKIAVMQVSAWHVAVISGAAESFVLLLALCWVGTRRAFPYELNNFSWAAFSEVFNFAGFTSLYFAMALLPTSIAASITAIMPLYVLFAERIFDGIGGRISRDHLLLPKLLPIALITIGVMLLAYVGFS
jgi:drug/metabolite transporter (DMT)-like permease